MERKEEFFLLVCFASDATLNLISPLSKDVDAVDIVPDDEADTDMDVDVGDVDFGPNIFEFTPSTVF